VRWLLPLLIVACNTRAESPPPDRAFYYWRTTFHLSPAEQRALSDLQVTKLYVRLFDVDWNVEEARPVVVGAIAGDRAPAVDIVPVVFLRNEVFKHGKLQGLAKTVGDEVTRRMATLGATAHELQLDCDWTDTTRDRFFAFVREIKKETRLPLSATIRLHQIKYREKTGVPPVERGMLMFYNMGKFSADTGDRAIFDERTAANYIERLGDYPLPLDVALPIWSWTVHVRDDRVIDLLQSTDPDELPRHDFLVPGGLDRFVVTRTAFLHGAVLREGDVLKIERMGPTETRAAADMLAGKLAVGSRTVALFDLSERNLQRYAGNALDHVYRSVR
jgi:hypothetical protein